MIPDFTPTGVLPPYLGDPAQGQRAPYPTTTAELVARLGDTPHRLDIIEGLLRYRVALRAAGFDRGVQWLDGSFVEQKVPNDIDVVTWVNRPMDIPAQQALLQALPFLFDSQESKARFKTDAYLMNLASLQDDPLMLITYWYGLFSHQRVTDRWKGLLAVALDDVASDEAAASMIAARRGA